MSNNNSKNNKTEIKKTDINTNKYKKKNNVLFFDKQKNNSKPINIKNNNENKEIYTN